MQTTRSLSLTSTRFLIPSLPSLFRGFFFALRNTTHGLCHHRQQYMYIAQSMVPTPSSAKNAQPPHRIIDL